MPSLIFLIPVLSSTMDPVARVVIETFLDDIFLDDDENTFEETLLLPARDADMDRTEAIISIGRECNKKKKELCFVVGDVRRKQPRAQSVNEDLKGGGCRKTKEGNNTKGEDVTLFFVLCTERCRERDHKKKPKERDEKRVGFLRFCFLLPI